MAYGDAVRMFSGPLSVGQTFSIDYDDSGRTFSLSYSSSLVLLTPSGTAGVAVDANLFADYVIELPNGSRIDTGVAETDQGVQLEFTQLSSGVQVSLMPYIAGAATTTIDAQYTGQVGGVGFSSSGFPGAEAAYINNIAITPEPSCAAFLA